MPTRRPPFGTSPPRRIGTLPAIAAGQIAPWNQDFIMSYQGMAEATEGIAAAIEGAEKVS